MTTPTEPASSKDKPEIPPEDQTEDQSAEEEEKFVPRVWRYRGRFHDGPVVKRFVRYPY